MIYFDSSALVKIVVEEAEHDALARWLLQFDEVRVSSELSLVEVVRTCSRGYEEALPYVRVLLEQLQMVPLTTVLLESAASVGPPSLRSLDAIHLASAISLGPELTAFVTYDRRLQAAAEAERLPVVAPA